MNKYQLRQLSVFLSVWSVVIWSLFVYALLSYNEEKGHHMAILICFGTAGVIMNLLSGLSWYFYHKKPM